MFQHAAQISRKADKHVWRVFSWKNHSINEIGSRSSDRSVNTRVVESFTPPAKTFKTIIFANETRTTEENVSRVKVTLRGIKSTVFYCRFCDVAFLPVNGAGVIRLFLRQRPATLTNESRKRTGSSLLVSSTTAFLIGTIVLHKKLPGI